jgi:hypothetical protein
MELFVRPVLAEIQVLPSSVVLKTPPPKEPAYKVPPLESVRLRM